jgi:hypothetical protein
MLDSARYLTFTNDQINITENHHIFNIIPQWLCPLTPRYIILLKQYLTFLSCQSYDSECHTFLPWKEVKMGNSENILSLSHVKLSNTACMYVQSSMTLNWKHKI